MPTNSISFGFFIFTELFVSFLVGGVPLLISYGSPEPDGMDKMVSSLIPPDTLFWYSVWLTVIAVSIDFLNRFFYKKSVLANAIWYRIDDIVSQVSSSAQAILRIVSGITLTFVALWAAVDYQSFHVGRGLFFMYIGIVALVEAAGLRWLQVWLAIKWVHRK